MQNSSIFENKIVLITGSGKGIGRSIALEYAKSGAFVVIADIDAENGARTDELIGAVGGESIYIEADIRDPKSIEALMSTVEIEYGRIDILVNNAGIFMIKNPAEITVAEWDMVMNTNIRGAFLCSREAAKIMRKNGGGSIINIASTRALMSEPHTEAYAASKGGIISLTHALAASYAKDKIQVNAISPGWIEANGYDSLRDIDHTQHLSGRVGHPEDIARACLFLSSPDNGFINGANLVIDGGMTKKMIYEL